MALSDNDLRLLAKFFYKHRNQKTWWSAPLLLVHEEVKSFGLSNDEAVQVFETFEKKGFLKKFAENKTIVDGISYQTYLFDLSGVKELQEYSNIPFYYKFFSEQVSDRIHSLHTFLIVSFVLITTSFLQLLITDIYNWLKNILK